MMKGKMKKVTPIAAIFIVVALLSMPLTAHAAGSQQITRTFEASANAVVASEGDGDGFETNPTYAYADGSPGSAVDSASGKNNNNDPASNGTDKHNYYNYGMDTIPSTATISGITVRADIAVSSTAEAEFTAIRLSWDAGTTWTTVKQQTLTATGETTYTYGGSADNWGHTWSGLELTDTNFRVQVINGDTSPSSSPGNFSLDYIAVSITFTPIWDSYSDTGRTTVCDLFSGSVNTVYMKGTGFWSNATTQTYNVSYYDGGGAKVTTDAGIALVNVVSDRGDLGNTSSPYEPTYTLTTDPTAAAGTWHAVAQPSGGTSFPDTYATLSANPDTYELLADDTFTVETSAIPEFSTVIAAIGVAGLCFGIYFWMRKRRLAYVKA